MHTTSLQQREGDMQLPTVTEISRQTYHDAQRAWHRTQVRLVRESLLRANESGAKRP
jgi:hypothetical protein